VSTEDIVKSVKGRKDTQRFYKKGGGFFVVVIFFHHPKNYLMDGLV
jgi:hypothetical protein